MRARRIGLVLAVLALGLLCACAAGHSEQGTLLTTWKQNKTAAAQKDAPAIVLRLTHSSGENSIANDAATAMKERLEAVSGGTMSIEIFANDSLGSLNDAWNSFGNGTVDMRIGTADIPQQGAVMWLPLLAGVDCTQLQQALTRGKPLRMKLESWSKEKNSLILGILPLQYRVLASNVPVESRSNMRQLTMRTIGNGGDNAYWETLCGKTKDVKVQQLALALQQNEVNACDNTITNLVEYGTYRQVRYLTEMTDRVYFDMILVNSQRMASLNERQQQWILDAASYAENQIAAQQPTYEQQAMDTLRQAGIRVYTLPEEEKQSIRDAAQGVMMQEYTEKIGAEDLGLLLQYVQEKTQPIGEEN